MKWKKIIEKANTLSDQEILDKYRSDYLFDSRHLDIAELKWSKRYLDARLLSEEIEETHKDYYQWAKKMGQVF